MPIGSGESQVHQRHQENATMDHHFDRITRTLGSGNASRRGVLRIVGVAALTAALGWAGADSAVACGKRRDKCEKRKRCCAGFICKSGRCRRSPVPPKIPTGGTCDPAKPVQCASGVCGCHAGACSCRNAQCGVGGCGTDMDCCEGYCHIANFCQTP
jgi:hypothetical protein